VETAKLSQIETATPLSPAHLYRLGTTENVPPEDGYRIISPKCLVLNGNMTVDNVQKHTQLSTSELLEKFSL
jgi:hypothetical protein